MKNELTIIPQATIHPDRIIITNRLEYSMGKPSRVKLSTGLEGEIRKEDRIINSARTANGNVSSNAKRKISRAIDYLLLMTQETRGYIPRSGKHFKFRIAFVTFTLPSTQVHSDKEIKQELWNQMLIELVKYHNVKNYLWRAEKQKNGNIHFHLLIDKFVLYSDLRKRWNRICNKLGYVDRYAEAQREWHAEGFRLRIDKIGKWSEEDQKKAYIRGQKCNWTSPNSTDIHSVKNIRNIVDYVSKYLEKPTDLPEAATKEQIEKLIVKGRIWGCNNNLSDIRGARLDVDSVISAALAKVENITHCRKYSDTYFSVYYITLADCAKYSADCLFKEFSHYMFEHFHYSSQLYTG